MLCAMSENYVMHFVFLVVLIFFLEFHYFGGLLTSTSIEDFLNFIITFECTTEVYNSLMHYVMHSV